MAASDQLGAGLERSDSLLDAEQIKTILRRLCLHRGGDGLAVFITRRQGDNDKRLFVSNGCHADIQLLVQRITRSERSEIGTWNKCVRIGPIPGQLIVISVLYVGLSMFTEEATDMRRRSDEATSPRPNIAREGGSIDPREGTAESYLPSTALN